MKRVEKLNNYKEFNEFAKNREIVYEDFAIKKYYNNNYNLYRASVIEIFFVQESYQDITYFYDKNLNLIIEHTYSIGD